MPLGTYAVLWALAGAPAIALGLHVARHVDRVARQRVRAAEARAFEDVMELLAASRRSSRDVLVVLDRSLRELYDADATLALVPDGQELACVFACGERARHFEGLRIRRDDGSLPALAAATGCRAVAPAGATILPSDRYALAVPLLDDRNTIAVAYASWGGLERPPEHDATVRTIERAAVPYALARERERDRADAAYDGLTGLLGPRAFRRLLREEIERNATRRRRAASLWFVDTDGFKRVNDELGHRAGDRVLTAIAELLRAHAGEGIDVAARNGGDEFCALLRATGKSLAIARAQAFCDAVRAFDFGVPVRITASVGVASYPHDATSASELLEAADGAMYHSKRNGRDRVSFVTEAGFACVDAEAAHGVSRSSERCRVPVGDYSSEPSPH